VHGRLQHAHNHNHRYHESIDDDHIGYVIGYVNCIDDEHSDHESIDDEHHDHVGYDDNGYDKSIDNQPLPGALSRRSR
jgi:hypothetical protein